MEKGTIRKLFTAAIAALILGGGQANADTLSPEQSLERVYGAGSNGGGVQKAMSIARNRPQLVKTIATLHGKPAAYVFNSTADGDAREWIITGADDLATPLLGYGSGKADPDNMPPQLQWWLEEYARQIAAADSMAQQGATAGLSRRLKMAGEEAASAGRSSRIPPYQAQIGPLLTTTWDQNDPYNRYTPEYANENTPTGCVATAMAQVMNYFEYPAKGKGTGYATLGDTQLSRSLDVTFDWTNMADDYLSASRTEAQKEAVANLMVTCGYAVNMSYAPMGSGASDMNMIRAMVNTFDYDKGAWIYYRDHYSFEEWEQMLVDNLKETGPFYYSGQAPDGAHAFVCDGYDGDGYFSFNWGWSGYYNGFFVIDALDPDGQGTGGFEGGYNTMQQAMLGCRPPVEGSKRPQAQLTQYGILKASLDGNRLTLSFDGNDDGWFNMSYVTANVLIGLELENISTGSKTMASAFDRTSSYSTYHGRGSVSLTIPSSIPDGSYRARVVTKESGYGVWMPSLCDYGNRNYVEINMQSGVASLGSKTSDELEIQQATLYGPLYEGEAGSYSIRLYNGTNATIEQPLAFALINSQNYILAHSGTDVFTVAPQQTLERTVTFELTYSEGFEFNTDYVALLYNPQTMTIAYNLGVTQVINESVLAPSIVESMVTKPLYYGQKGTYGFTLKNPTAQDVSYNVTAALINDDYLVMAMDEYNVTSVNVAAGQTKTFTLEFDFSYYDENFELGRDYYFVILNVASNESLSLMDVVDIVSVESNPDEARMDCRTFYLEGDNENATPTNLQFVAEVSCLNKSTTDYFIVGIWDSAGQYLGAVTSSNVALQQGVYRQIRVGINFSEATPGASYIAALLDSKYNQISEDLIFTVTGTDGIAETTDERSLSLEVNAQSRTALALSSSEITAIKVYNACGALLHTPSEVNGNRALVDLEGLSGMVIVTVTDASGAQVTKKAML